MAESDLKERIYALERENLSQKHKINQLETRNTYLQYDADKNSRRIQQLEEVNRMLMKATDQYLNTPSTSQTFQPSRTELEELEQYKEKYEEEKKRRKNEQEENARLRETLSGNLGDVKLTEEYRQVKQELEKAALETESLREKLGKKEVDYEKQSSIIQLLTTEKEKLEQVIKELKEKKKGRPPIDAMTRQTIRFRMANGEGATKVAREMGVSRAMVYKILNEEKKEATDGISV